MIKRTLLLLLLASAPLGAQVSYERLLHAENEPRNWLTYAGTFRSERYSALKQITLDNVRNLEPQWVFQSLGWSALDQVETNLLDEFSPDVRRIATRLWDGARNRTSHRRQP